MTDDLDPTRQQLFELGYRTGELMHQRMIELTDGLIRLEKREGRDVGYLTEFALALEDLGAETPGLALCDAFATAAVEVIAQAVAEQEPGGVMTARHPTDRAVGQAVYEATIDLMSAVGSYPMTREDILTAIENGVARGVADHLDRHPLNRRGTS